MKVAIMQPYFFPYIGYWQLINIVDVFVIYDIGKFRPRGWINRNKIKLNGKEKYITIPIHRSINLLIKDEKIIDAKSFRRKTERMLIYSYGKSKYYEEVKNSIIEGIKTDTDDLTEYLISCIKKICELINIETKIVLASELPIAYGTDAVSRITDICCYYDADIYINPIGGVDIYRKEDFKQQGIELKFLRAKSITYNQREDPFLPNLSIIDVLMNCGIEKTKLLLGEYELV